MSGAGGRVRESGSAAWRQVGLGAGSPVPAQAWSHSACVPPACSAQLLPKSSGAPVAASNLYVSLLHVSSVGLVGSAALQS